MRRIRPKAALVPEPATRVLVTVCGCGVDSYGDATTSEYQNSLACETSQQKTVLDTAQNLASQSVETDKLLEQTVELWPRLSFQQPTTIARFVECVRH